MQIVSADNLATSEPSGAAQGTLEKHRTPHARIQGSLLASHPSSVPPEWEATCSAPALPTRLSISMPMVMREGNACGLMIRSGLRSTHTSWARSAVICFYPNPLLISHMHADQPADSASRARLGSTCAAHCQLI